MKSSVLKVVKTLTDVEWLDLEELEEIEMCEAEKRWLEVKSKEWEAEGIRKGIEQGIEQGIERGIEQGAELGQVLLYKTMIKNGMSVNEISKVCSISVESLKRALSN